MTRATTELCKPGVEYDMTDWGDATVRVTRVRRARFVEFDFSLGEDLVVELVLPYGEFRAFCDERHARMLPAQGEAALEFSHLASSWSNTALSNPAMPNPDPGKANYEESQ